MMLEQGSFNGTDTDVEFSCPEGKPYHVALGAIANKLLHIIYAVLRDNKP
jgi:hypothetical protein